MTHKLVGKFKKEEIEKYHEIDNASNNNIMKAKLIVLDSMLQHDFYEKTKSATKKFFKATNRKAREYTQLVKSSKIYLSAKTETFIIIETEELELIESLCKYLNKVYPTIDFQIEKSSEEILPKEAIELELNRIKTKLILSAMEMSKSPEGINSMDYIVHNQEIGYNTNYIKELEYVVSDLNTIFSEYNFQLDIFKRYDMYCILMR